PGQVVSVLFMKKLFSKLIIILVFAVAAALIYLPLIITFILTRALESGGVNLEKLELSYPAINSLTVKSARLLFPLESETMAMDIRKATLIYSPWTLIQARLVAVNADSVILTYSLKEPDKKEEKRLAGRILAPSLRPLYVKLPFSTLKIKNFDFNIKRDSHKTISGKAAVSIVKSGNKARLELSGALRGPGWFDELRYSLNGFYTLRPSEQFVLKEESSIELIRPEAEGIKLGSIKITPLNNTTGFFPAAGTPFRGEFLLKLKQLNLSGYKLSDSSGRVSLNSNGEKIKLKLDLLTDKIPLAFKLTATLRQNLVPIDYTARLSSDSAPEFLSWLKGQAFSALPVNFKSSAGAIVLTLKKPEDQKTPRGYLKVSSLDGRYRDISFLGLRAEVPFKLSKGISIDQKARIYASSVDFGFKLSDIKMTPALSDRNSFALNNISFNLLGGTGFIKRFILPDKTHPVTFTLQLKSIDLKKVLELEGQKGLYASGRIDGTIPVSLKRGKITVRSGKLSSLPPGGIIRYDSGDAFRSNPATAFLANLLKNYHYSNLSADLSLFESGTLKIAVKLEGKNPDLNNGRQVNVNLNVEENLPALLKSLKLERGLETDIKTINNRAN
ncbi:MAG: hypothetical protein D6719_09030, partial [Candidatus Dadabacteria bacterium]